MSPRVQIIAKKSFMKSATVSRNLQHGKDGAKSFCQLTKMSISKVEREAKLDGELRDELKGRLSTEC
jgi:hypothetical protein